jgi:hypothetical protein
MGLTDEFPVKPASDHDHSSQESEDSADEGDFVDSKTKKVMIR